MIYLRNNFSLIQYKINVLLFTWLDLDMCLEFIYELILTLLLCYEDDFEEVKEYFNYDCNLKKLDLKNILIIILINNARLTDLSILSSLTNLKKLDLFFIKTTDISSISVLTNLKELYLNDTIIIDTTVLDHLKPKLHIY